MIGLRESWRVIVPRGGAFGDFPHTPPDTVSCWTDLYNNEFLDALRQYGDCRVRIVQPKYEKMGNVPTALNGSIWHVAGAEWPSNLLIVLLTVNRPGRPTTVGGLYWLEAEGGDNG